MEILGLDWHIWMTVILILGMFVTLCKTNLATDAVFLSVVAILVITGCIDTKSALNSFGDQSVIIVGALFVVIAGLDASGVLHWIVKNLLGQPSSYLRAILHLMLPVSFLSAFLSNTTVVALFVKIVKIWAQNLHIAPSKLLIPLSYAAGMGGVCTLIGTPPNLIIGGFYSEATSHPLGIFCTTLPGLFCLAVGVFTIIILQRLLPSRKLPEEQLGNITHSCITNLTVPADGNLPGQTLMDINLIEKCHNCRLIGIMHFDGEVEQINTDCSPDDIYIMGHDTFVFSGNRDEILQIGKQLGMNCDAYDMSEHIRIDKHTAISSVIMIAMVLLSAFNVLPLVHCCFIAALLMLITHCCNIRQAKEAINWDVLMVFASSVAIGKAIDATGLAQLMANSTIDMCHSNALFAFIVICFLGTFLTEFISNTACGAIMAPIALQIATNLNANPMTFCIGLMISVSSSFATPIGSPTHLLVYVPGGYRFTDFLRIGLPMNFIILAANIFITLMLFPI